MTVKRSNELVYVEKRVTERRCKGFPEDRRLISNRNKYKMQLDEQKQESIK